MKRQWKLLFNSVLLLSALSHNLIFAQLPQCSLIYLDQYNLIGTSTITSTGNIYTYNPALPSSSTNPSLNSIHIQGQSTLGLTISEILNSGNPTLTFYTVTDDQYWYYNPTTSAWVNTNHFTGSAGTAYNIASGGGYIYNLSGTDGNVYVYDGTGDGSFLVNIPDFIEEGPYDLIADCAGNFYVLNVTAVMAAPFLRKYNHSGMLLKSWTVNNPNNYFTGNGFGLTAGFGIIGSTIYVDNIDVNGVKSIVTGTINNTTVDFGGAAIPAILPFQTDDFPGDFGSCASSVPALPQITITASATSIIAGTPVTFTSTINDGGTNPQYQWYVNGVAVSGAINSTYTYVPNHNDVITCMLTSDLPCLASPATMSNPLTIIVEGCPPVTLSYGHDSFCKSEGQTAPAFSPAGGTFSINPAGLNIDPNTGAIDLSTANLGDYIITYSVAATPDCPADSAQYVIKILSSPSVIINLNNDDKMLCINERITLTATITTNESGYSFKWSPREYFPFGDSTATVTAKIAGQGPVYLNISNTNSCNAADSLVFNPEHCCNVMIPSAFSPNHDALNDIFKINSIAIQQLNQFSVYNRFGQRIFFSADQNIGWDGSYKNKDAEPGVYYYYISYTCSDGTNFVKKGDVTLIR